MKRKICVVTGSRADYGLLRWLMQEIKGDQDLELQVLATGMHLSETFGMTYKEIASDGFKINEKITVLNGDDSGLSLAKSISLGVSGCAEAFERLKPDLIIETVDPHFGFSRYAERLGRSASSFDEMYQALQLDLTYIDEITLELLNQKILSSQPNFIAFS